MAGLTITLDLDPPAADREAIIAGLRSYNRSHAIAPGWSPMTLLLRDEAGTVQGGLIGESGWDWLHIQFLWVAEALQGQGHGRALLTRAEVEARTRGCRGVHLDSHQFQAPAFYQRLGYQVFGVLEDYPAGSRRFFLSKAL